MIDLRSDTLTKPTAAMREAMAAADVGDDVYGEDPTINRLEARAAEVFGREAALFVPTGTMGNQIAIRLHTEHGQEVICEAQSHVLDWEMAMVSAFSGCVPRAVASENGVLTWDRIATALYPKVYYRAATGLICLENTHNMAGGVVTPVAVLEEIWEGARQAGLPTHLDGARVFNAATALGEDVKTITRGFDTVMFCLSKGLGAPVGSMLVGSKAMMARAKVFRKALGGGMRQAGVLAAAGLIALEEMPKRLGDDHANARRMAQAIAASPHVELNLATVQTNIVMLRLRAGDAANVVSQLRERGVVASAIGTNRVRLVTHYDVSLEQCERAAQILLETVSEAAS